MPDGVIFRVLISLALGIPSLVLWPVLRFTEKRWGLPGNWVADWLKVLVFVVLILDVVFSAMDKGRLASGLRINFWGLFLVWNWVQRRSKLSEQAPTILNISGRESVSAR